MSEKEDYADYWKEKWQNSETFFHRAKNHPFLEKNLEKILNKNGRILFPCCGKEVDMAWLASLGHQVVGVEISEVACEQFFSENGLNFSIKMLEQFKLFTSEDGRLKIYNGDFFNFGLKYEKPFESVWDRGSYVALPKELRDMYPSHMKNLLEENARYLLDVVEYDQSLYSGPPFSISHDEVKINFGSVFNCEIIEQKEIKPCHPGMDQVGTMKEILYFLNVKKNSNI